MMDLNVEGLELAEIQLEAALGSLEHDASNGRYGAFCIKTLADAATLLSLPAIVRRAVRLLQVAPDGAYWAGMITNIELPDVVPERMRCVSTLEELEEQYPPYDEQTILGRTRSYSKNDLYFARCLEGRFAEARSIAVAGVSLEEVGVTLAVLGEFEEALDVARDEKLAPFRQRNVHFVTAIELFRRGQKDRSASLLAEMDLSSSSRIHLALAYAGREPWIPYPYPDW